MIIYRGNTEVFEVKDYKQIGKFMDVATIECTVKSPTPIVFKIGDYVVSDYNGLVFSLYDVYPQKKQARSGTYGEAFIYDLKFKADTEQLNICPFLDLVANDNEIVYSSLPSFTTFENVYGIAARIQANMDNLYPDKWRIQVAQTTDEDLLTELNEAKEFTISGESCLDGLKKIHDTWGVSYIHTVEDGVNVITIGKSAGTTSAFSYGMGQGLRAVKKNLQNADQLCTRAYVFGSTRNIPARWYNNKGYIGESQYAPNLMIPPSKWVNNVPQGAYIDAIFNLKQGDTILVDADNRIEKYGLKIKTLSYDGSDSSKEEIYPSVNGVTIGNIIDTKEEIGETTYIPSETHYSRTERVDEILEGSQIEDNGIGADADYVLGSDKVTAETKEATEKITIAEQKEGGKYTLLTPQEVVKLCSFKIEKAANYRVDEILDFVTLSKNDYESVISAKLYFQKPSGDYIPLTDNPVTLTDNLTAEVRLHGLTYPLNEVGTYNLILKIEVKPWSVDYVTPQIGDEVYVQYAVTGARVVLGRMENILSSFFTLKLKQIGFNLNDYTASDGSFKTIHVKSGMCSGRTFTITQCSYLETDDSWVITCKRQNDKSLSQRFPNSLFPVSAGDRFVLLNINMPDLYVHTAMQRLYDTAKADLEYLSRQQFVVEPEIDNIQLARSPQLLAEGMYMPIHEEDISIKEDILIDSVTITNRGNQLRTFDVTLRNDKVYNRFNKIASRLSEIETTLQEAQIANNSTDVDDTVKTEDIGGGSSAGMDEAALIEFLDKNNYTTTDDINELTKDFVDDIELSDALAPLNEIISSIEEVNKAQGEVITAILEKDIEQDNRLDTLESLGLSVKEKNGKKYLESAYDFYSKGGVSSGGVGGQGGGGGTGGGSTVSYIPTVKDGELLGKLVIDGIDTPVYSPSLADYAKSEDVANTYATKAALNDYATTTALGTATDNITTLQGYFKDGIAKEAAKVSKSLKFGSKTYNGSAEATVTADDLGALTSHQTIYKLSFESGTFAAGDFTANVANKTIKVPTTTSHISEGDNLYYTNARVLKAVADSLGLSTKTENGKTYLRSAYDFFSEGGVSSGGIGTSGGGSGSGSTVSYAQAISSGIALGTLTIDGVTTKNTIYAPSVLSAYTNDVGYITASATVTAARQVNPTNHGTHIAIVNSNWSSLKVLGTGYTSDLGDYTELLVPGQSTNNATLKLLKNGNVLIGATADEGVRLLLANAGDTRSQMQFQSSITVGNIGVDSNGLYLYQPDNKAIYFHTSKTERMRITGGGNVFVGATNDDGSGAKLQVSSSNAAVLALNTTNAQNALLLRKDNVNKLQLGYHEDVGSFLYDYTAGVHLGIDANGNAYYGASTSVTSSNHYTLYHTGNFNPADYLPKNGGTINGRLLINSSSTSDTPLWLKSNSTDANGACRIQFVDSSNTFQGYVMTGWGNLFLAHRSYNQIGVGNNGIWCSSDNGATKNTIIHSGNYSSYALPLSGGELNMLSFSNFIINSKDTSINRSSMTFRKDGDNKAQIGWDAFQNWGTFIYNYASNSVLGVKDDGTPHYNGNTLIHSGNIGSQTVLAANKIVRGTTDILTVNNTNGISIKSDAYIGGSGVGGSLYIQTTATNTGNRVINISAPNLNTTGGGLLMYMGVAESKYNGGYLRYSYKGLGSTENALRLGFWGADDLFSFLANGNVIIGTTTDNGAKLQVDGNILPSVNWRNTATGENGGYSLGSSSFAWSTLYVHTIDTFQDWSLQLNCNGVTRVRMGTSYLRSETNGGTTLGTVDYRWGALYGTSANFNGGITLAAGYNNDDTLTAANIVSRANIYIPYNTYGFSISYSGRNGGVFMSNGESDGSALYNMYLQPFGGNVVIGAKSGASDAKLYVAGNFFATGGLASGQPSDRRLKENICTISTTDAVSVLRKLNPIFFKWNALATSLDSRNTGDSVGFIADEYEGLIVNSGRDIWEKYRAIDYTKAIPYLAKGWQIHDAILVKHADNIEDLRSRVEVLEKENRELKNRLNMRA